MYFGLDRITGVNVPKDIFSMAWTTNLEREVDYRTLITPNVANYRDLPTNIQIVTKKMSPELSTTLKLVCPNVPKKNTLLQECIKLIVTTCIVLLNLNAVVWSPFSILISDILPL